MRYLTKEGIRLFELNSIWKLVCDWYGFVVWFQHHDKEYYLIFQWGKKERMLAAMMTFLRLLFNNLHVSFRVQQCHCTLHLKDISVLHCNAYLLLSSDGPWFLLVLSHHIPFPLTLVISRSRKDITSVATHPSHLSYECKNNRRYLHNMIYA